MWKGDLENMQEKKKSVIREAFEWIVYFLIVIVLTYLFLTYVGQRTCVSGRSMEPTLANGDSLIVDKITYRFKDPERYDIIVFPYQYEQDVYYIKRIIGLPGETVQVMNGKVYINGEELLDEHYAAEEMESAGMAAQPIVLGADEYFVLGDNRNHSSDSRDPSVGILKRENLVGKAWLRVWPFDTIGFIKHD